MIELGRPAPGFDLVDQHRNRVTLDDLRGRPALVIFMPFAFTRVCGSEMCDLRDNLAHLEALDAGVVVITCDSAAANRAWAEAEGFGFTILSDFWPHGQVTRAYGTFNETLGVADRTSYVLDSGGFVRTVISTGSLKEPRPFASYTEALAAV